MNFGNTCTWKGSHCTTANSSTLTSTLSIISSLCNSTCIACTCSERKMISLNSQLITWLASLYSWEFGGGRTALSTSSTFISGDCAPSSEVEWSENVGHQNLWLTTCIGRVVETSPAIVHVSKQCLPQWSQEKTLICFNPAPHASLCGPMHTSDDQHLISWEVSLHRDHDDLSGTESGGNWVKPSV